MKELYNDIFEQQILKALKDSGYSFECKHELEEFARTRCKLLTFKAVSKKVLTVDDKKILEFWDDERFHTKY